MSQRIVRMLPRILMAARVSALQYRIPLHLSYSRNFINLSMPRRYSSQQSQPRGIPIKDEVAQEQLMTPAEKERTALHNDAL